MERRQRTRTRWSAAAATCVCSIVTSVHGLQQGAQYPGGLHVDGIAAKTCEPERDALSTRLSDEDKEYLHGVYKSISRKSLIQRHPRHRACNSAKDIMQYMQPLLLPEYKLAFCYVPKVACTQFKDLFNTINKLPAHTMGFGRGYTASMAREWQIDMRTVTHQNGWKFATFTRDPVSRYVSAFGSTCVPNADGIYEHAYDCCGDLVGQNDSRAILAQTLQERVQMDVDMGVPASEDHWVQQVEVLYNCGWDKFNPALVDYWGSLSGNVTAKVIEMLAMVNYTNTSRIKEFFPSDKVAGHTNTMHGGAGTFVQDAKTLEGIMKIYEADYRNVPGIGCSYTDHVLRPSQSR